MTDNIKSKFVLLYTLYRSILHISAQVAKTKKLNFISSFVRFVALVKSPKRQNAKNKISFLRLFVLSRCTSRQNEEMEFHFFVCSFCRIGQGTTKRQSYREISKFDLSWILVRFVVCSFCRLQQGAKTTERQRDKMRFCGHFALSFVRFVALYKSPKRINEISFWRLFVLSPSIRHQNERTKWPYTASIPTSLSLYVCSPSLFTSVVLCPSHFRFFEFFSAVFRGMVFKSW